MICNPYQTRRFPWSKRPNLSHISELLRICLTRHLHLKIPAQGRALECAGEHQPFNTGRDPAPTGCSCKEPRVLCLTHTSHRLLVQRAAGVVPYSHLSPAARAKSRGCCALLTVCAYKQNRTFSKSGRLQADQNCAYPIYLQQAPSGRRGDLSGAQVCWGSSPEEDEKETGRDEGRHKSNVEVFICAGCVIKM
jgi:hypothetical protein